MIGSIASGSLAGRQQAQQEQDAESPRQQQMALQGIGIQQSALDHDAARRVAPFEALRPLVGQMRPEQQADFYTKYTQASAPQGPGVDYNSAANAFDPDSPMRAMFQHLGSMGAAPGGMPGGGMQPPGGGMPGAGIPPPAGPPVDRMAGGPSGTPTAIPPTGAPGAAPPPGGAPGARPVPTVQTPFGSFGIGPDPKQVTAARSEIARMVPRFSKLDLPPEFRQQADALAARANQQVEGGDLDGARQSISQLQGLEMDIPRQGRIGGADLIKNTYQQHKDRLGQLRTKTATGGGAYADVTAVYDLEKKGEELNTAHPDLAAPGMDDLLPYKDQIEEMRGQFQESRALRSKKDRTPADEARIKQLDQQWSGTAQSLHDMLHFGVDPKQRTAGLGAVRGYLAMLPPDQRTSENVARLLEANGDKPMAAVVRDRGLNFAGDEAEKSTEQLLRGVGDVLKPGTPDAVRQAYTDRLRQQSALTGHPVAIDAKLLNRPDIKDQPGTAAFRATTDAHLKSVQEFQRLKAQNVVDIQGGKWQPAVLGLDLQQAKLDEATGKIDPKLLRSAIVAKMRTGQHTVDQAYGLYNRYVNDPHTQLDAAFDPEKWTATHKAGDVTALDDDTARAVRLYQNWQQSVTGQKGLIDNIAKSQQGKLAGNSSPRGGTTVQATTAKRAAAPAAPNQQQIRETYYQGLLKSGATPHEANLLMQHRFPGGQ
jgi:hypothetical protein